jgi:beta-phosphoglucomutase-like phosphatase (HAD superfamily)
MRGAIFDFDGVLVDSEPLHYRALRQCLLGAGIEITEDEYRREYLAYDDWESIRIALERHGEAVASAAKQAATDVVSEVDHAAEAAAPLRLGRAVRRRTPLRRHG